MRMKRKRAAAYSPQIDETSTVYEEQFNEFWWSEWGSD